VHLALVPNGKRISGGVGRAGDRTGENLRSGGLYFDHNEMWPTAALGAMHPGPAAANFL